MLVCFICLQDKFTANSEHCRLNLTFPAGPIPLRVNPTAPPDFTLPSRWAIRLGAATPLPHHFLPTPFSKDEPCPHICHLPTPSSGWVPRRPYKEEGWERNAQTLTKHYYAPNSLVSFIWQRGSVGLWVWALEADMPRNKHLSHFKSLLKFQFLQEAYPDHPVYAAIPLYKTFLSPLSCLIFQPSFRLLRIFLVLCLPDFFHWNVVPRAETITCLVHWYILIPSTEEVLAEHIRINEVSAQSLATHA